MAVGRSKRLDPALAAIKKLADGRLCSPGPVQHAITAALRGDRSHQQAFNAAHHLVPQRLNNERGLEPRVAFDHAAAAFFGDGRNRGAGRQVVGRPEPARVRPLAGLL